jgi:hypothetical protein
VAKTVSPNRRYTQLTFSDVGQLLDVFNAGVTRYGELEDDRLWRALIELYDKAKSIPDARICLAHAVFRGTSGNRVVIADGGKVEPNND